MQELKFEQVEVVSGGVSSGPFIIDNYFTANAQDGGGSSGGFWSNVGDGIGNFITSAGRGFERLGESLNDLTSSFKNWTDSNNIERMCASGAVDTVKTDGMEVKCNTKQNK